MNRTPLPKLLNSILLFLFITSCYSYTSEKYFPDKAFSTDIKQNSLVNDWYEKQLIALKEPSIYHNAQPAKEMYRFLWLRTFHHPVAIRLEINPDGTGILYTKMASGAGGYDPGNLSVNKTKSITRAEIAKLLQLISTSKFWNLQPNENTVGLDGAQWIIEGLSKRKYHFVDRWSPKEGYIRELGVFFLKLSDLKIPEEDIY